MREPVILEAVRTRSQKTVRHSARHILTPLGVPSTGFWSARVWTQKIEDVFIVTVNRHELEPDMDMVNPGRAIAHGHLCGGRRGSHGQDARRNRGYRRAVRVAGHVHGHGMSTATVLERN